MKTALISGANGFIGRNLIKRLLRDNIQVYALVLKNETPAEVLNNELVSVVPCDLENSDFSDIDIPYEIDIFYHFAWIGVRPEDRKNFDVQLRNVNMTLNCMRLAKAKRIKRAVMSGSTNEYLFSGKEINAGCVPTPSDDYGSTKVSVRFLAKQYARDNGIEFIYAVISGIYSEQRRDSNVITYTIEKLLKNEKPSVTKLEQLWDYVYIDDAVDALYLIGEKGRDGALYAVGHGDNWPLRNYVEIIHRKIDPSLPLGIGEVPYASDKMPMSCVDMTDLTADTGYIPKVSFEEGITRVIETLRAEK